MTSLTFAAPKQSWGHYPSVAILAVSMAITTTTTTLADSLFLANYPVQSLPYYLVVLHLLGIGVTGLLLMSGRNNSHPKKFFFIHLVFALVAFNTAVWSGGVWWISKAVLCVIAHTAATMINLAIWAQTMGHVHTDKAKSQVPFLAAGLTIGGMLSGAFVVWASNSFVVANTLFFFIILLVAATPLVFLLEKTMGQGNPEVSKEYSATHFSFTSKKNALRDPLVQFLALVSFLFAVGSTFLDFQYKSVLQNQPNAERIAFYLGGLHLVLNVLVLTGQLTLSKLMVQQIRVHRIFPFYPRLVLLAVFSSLFLPLLLGAFFARVTERTFRYLILNATTDIFMGPMRSHFKTRAVWLTKGIAFPLGTLVSIIVILLIFQFVEPGDPLQVNLLYILTIGSFVGALFFSSKLEVKYRSFLATSLGVAPLEKRSAPLGVMPIRRPKKASISLGANTESSRLETADMETLFAEDHPMKRRKRLFRMRGQLTPEGAQSLMGFLEDEQDIPVLKMALRFLCQKQQRLRTPVSLLEHENEDVRFFARYLLTEEIPACDGEGKNVVQHLCWKLEIGKPDHQQISDAIERIKNVGPPDIILPWLVEMLMQSTPWPAPEATIHMPRWRHMVGLYRHFTHHPIYQIVAAVAPELSREERNLMALQTRSHCNRLWYCYEIAFCLSHPEVIQASFCWAQHLHESDRDYLLPLMEHPDPFVRGRILSLLYLSKTSFDEVSFTEANLIRGIQRTSLDCMIGAGILAELQKSMIGKQVKPDRADVQGFARLLNAQLNETTTLFFGLYGLMVGPVWAKQLYLKFARGSQMTRADVVEYCRTQAESKIIEPMMMVLGSFHPDKTLSNLKKHLPRVKGTFLGYAEANSRLKWFRDWIYFTDEQKQSLGRHLQIIGDIPHLKKLPPQLLFDMARNAQELKTPIAQHPANGADGIGLLLSTRGEVVINREGRRNKFPSKLKGRSSIWRQSTIRELVKADNRLDIALHLLENESTGNHK